MDINMDVFDGFSGAFRYTKQFDEEKIIEELKKGNAVNIYIMGTNTVVFNAISNRIQTDSDGFASLKK